MHGYRDMAAQSSEAYHRVQRGEREDGALMTIFDHVFVYIKQE